MAKKKKEMFFDECIAEKNLDPKQKGLWRLNGAVFVLERFPELRKVCSKCMFYKELPPHSYTCHRHYSTFEQVD